MIGWIVLILLLAGIVVGAVFLFRSPKPTEALQASDRKSILQSEGKQFTIQSADPRFGESVSLATNRLLVAGEGGITIYTRGEEEYTKESFLSVGPSRAVLSRNGEFIFLVRESVPNRLEIRQKSDVRFLTLDSPILALSRHPRDDRWMAVATQNGIRTYFGCACTGGVFQKKASRAMILETPDLVWGQDLIVSSRGVVFVLSPETLEERHRIVGEEDGFGLSLAHTGKRILVGAPLSNEVFEYAPAGKKWTRIRSYRSEKDEFLGSSLHSVGETELIINSRQAWYYANLATGENYAVEHEGSVFGVAAVDENRVVIRCVQPGLSVLLIKFK